MRRLLFGISILFIGIIVMERFSIECRNTKTKVITLTNHNSRKQSIEPIRARSKYTSPVPSAEKRVRVSHHWFWFLLLIGRGSGARFFNQSKSVAMQNQSNCGITFDTQLESSLYVFLGLRRKKARVRNISQKTP